MARRVVYLVFSHRAPDQVLRLARVLAEGPSASVVVRHDTRRTRLDRGALEEAGARLWEDDRPLEWGGFSQLERLLDGVRRAAEELDPDWLLVLSGQDYPLRPLADVERDLARSGHDAVLSDAWELPLRQGRPPPPEEEFFLRYAYRHWRPPPGVRPPGALRPLAYRRELPPRLGIRRLRPPLERVFVSADWLTLARSAIDAVVSAGEDRRLMSYWRSTALPSEGFFATVLLGDAGLEVSRSSRRFIPFEAPGAAHPRTLTVADLDRLEASDCDFARKFDLEVDAEVLDVLDRRRRAAGPR